MNGTIAEVRGFAGNFAPRTWAFCAGQLLAISSNTALFSLLGTTYGGDGRTTFKLPDLRGRTPVGVGTGPGLSTMGMGSTGGPEEVTMNTLTMAAHTHFVINSLTASSNISATVNEKASANPGNADSPTGNYHSQLNDGTPAFSKTAGDRGAQTDIAISGGINMSGTVTVGNTGAGQPWSNLQPFLACNYIICMQGVYPSRS